VDKVTKKGKKKTTEKKTCKIGGLWIDPKHYPLLAQTETPEQNSCKDESDGKLSNLKKSRKKETTRKPPLKKAKKNSG
jgi:hypothetical protein